MAAQITGGVDTHLDVHVVAALDELGALVGVESFPTNPAGYRALRGWLCSHGEVVVVGVEGTGSYGAGLARHLQHEGVAVVEVDRPNRQRRRRQGKTDPHDAVTAARAAQAGDALGAAKLRDGNVEAIRVLRVVRCGAKRDRTRAINQMRALISTAPDDLRQQLRRLTIPKLVHRAAAFRPGGRRDVTSATRVALRTLARRVLELDGQCETVGCHADLRVIDQLWAVLKRAWRAIFSGTAIEVDAENALVDQSGIPLPPIVGTTTPYLYLVGRQVLIQETNSV